ncbi:endoplasmic reticulum metallopeptidase 1-like isoform X2 [Halyomorpha halys]
MFNMLPIRHYRRGNPKISTIVFLGIILVLSWSYWLILQIENNLPTPILNEDSDKDVNQFVAENALNLVNNLTKLGPRPVGSFENEVLAVSLLSRELNIISKKANKVHRILIDIQRVSGSFSLNFLDGMTSIYRNVQNVILKIGPHSEQKYSILMNCHFDSVPDSPGGSDNSAGCGVMLELLRIISLSPRPLKNNIIFLFNGAEENFLQGSHGFITQHKWAKDISAFINLEACGSGGRELLFQVGPENPWLMEAYSDTVFSPLASTLAQEVFQSGVIPGDTDYRIFRDFGKIPGFDFAWAVNGYVYHTKLDNAENVPIKSLQRTGNNLLPLVTRLAFTKYPIEGPKNGNLVFFDIVGKIMFRVPESSSYLIAIVAILSSYFIFSENSGTFYRIIPDYRKSSYYSHLLLVSGITVCSWALAVLFVFLYSQILIALDRCMSWYAKPAWILFLYGIPAIWIPARITDIIMNLHEKVLKSNWLAFTLHIDALQLIWTLALVICTLLHIRSAIVLSLYVLFLTIGNFLMGKIRFHDTTREGVTCLIVFALAMLIPFIQMSYIFNGALLVIIPIMGRSGSGFNAEGLIAVLSCLMFLLIFNHWVPLFCILDNFRKAIKYLNGIFMVAFLVLLLTPLGFPYSSDQRSLAPQRYMVLHVEQIFHEFDGSVSNDKGGYWIINLDINSPHTVSRLIPEINIAKRVDTCDTKLYCGLPYLIPVFSIIRETHWTDTPKPIISIPTELKMINMRLIDRHIRRYHFSVIGPDHMTFILSPILDADLISWSILNEKPLAGPSWNGRKTYFIYYSCGSDPLPLNFTVDLKVKPTNFSVMDIALTGHFLHGAHQRSLKLIKLLSQFPPWTVTSGWIATYKSYKF